MFGCQFHSLGELLVLYVCLNEIKICFETIGVECLFETFHFKAFMGFYVQPLSLKLLEAINFICLSEVYIKRVKTLFGKIEKQSRNKYSHILLVIEVRSFFSLPE